MLMILSSLFYHTPPPDIYTLSLHDALPISTRFLWTKPRSSTRSSRTSLAAWNKSRDRRDDWKTGACRSEEHTSELQSHVNLVCRLLLEKKKKTKNTKNHVVDT